MRFHYRLPLLAMFAGLLLISGVLFAKAQQDTPATFAISKCAVPSQDPPVYTLCQSAGSAAYSVSLNDIHTEVELKIFSSTTGDEYKNNDNVPQNTNLNLNYGGEGTWQNGGSFPDTKYLSDSAYDALLNQWQYNQNSPSSLVTTIFPLSISVPTYSTCYDSSNQLIARFIQIRASGMLVCKNHVSIQKDGTPFTGFPQQVTDNPWSGFVPTTLIATTTYSVVNDLSDCGLYIHYDKTDPAFQNSAGGQCTSDSTCYIKLTYMNPNCKATTPPAPLQMYKFFVPTSGFPKSVQEAIHLNQFVDNPPAAIFSCKSKNNAAITNNFAAAEPTRCDGTPSYDPDTGNTISGYQWTTNPAGPAISAPTGSITDVTYSNSNPTPYHLTLTVTSSYPASPNGLTASTTHDYIVHNAACAATYVAGSTVSGTNTIHDTYTVAYSYTYPIVGSAASELALTCAGDSPGKVESKSCTPNADNRAGTCTVVCKYDSPAIDNRKANPVAISVGGRAVNCNMAGAIAPPINNTPPVAVFNCTSGISQARVNNFAFHEPISCNGAQSYDLQPPSQTITAYDWVNPNCIPATRHVLAPVTVESGLDCSPPTGTTSISLVVTSTDGGVSPPTIKPYTFVDGTCGVVYDGMVATGGKIRDTYNVSYQYVYPFVEAASLTPITCSSRGGVAGTVDATSISCTPNAADSRFGKCRFTCVYNSLRIANRTAAAKLNAGRQISCGTGNSTANPFEPIDVTFFCYSNLDNSRRDNFAINENITCDSTGTNDPNPGYNITNYTWEPGDPTAPVTPDGPDINITYVCNPADNELVMLTATSTSGDKGSTSHTYVVKSPDCRIIRTGSDLGVITDNYRVDYHFVYPPVDTGDISVACNAAGGALGTGRVNSCTPGSGDQRAGSCEVTCNYPPGTSGRTIGATLTVTGMGGGCTIPVACAESADTAPEPTACFGLI